MTDLAFLLDVDNTLLDNDRLKSDLDASLRALLGTDATAQFWDIYERVRRSEEYVDFPATLAEFARHRPDIPIQPVAATLDGIDFRAYVYAGAFETLAHLDTLGLTVIVSDGDPVFQRRKIERSGLADAVNGRVVLTVHKQQELVRVFAAFPAVQYALIDDKTTIIADIGRMYPHLVTTVLVCQGKYARLRARPGPDLVVPHIADLVRVPSQEFFLTERGAVAALS